MERIFLIGDSIRMGYDKYVRNVLAGTAEVYFSHENARFAAYTLRHFPEWIEAEMDPKTVTVLHFNCGLWDTGRYIDNDPFTPLEVYIYYLRKIVEKMRIVCPRARIIFATSTPVIEDRYDDPATFFRSNRDIIRYNEEAVKLMRSLNVKINDLHEVASRLSEKSYSDGTHLYTPMGEKVLGDAVYKSILRAVTFA